MIIFDYSNIFSIHALADLVVVCTPVAHIGSTVRSLLDVCNPETLVTDAGSTKSEIVSAAESSPMSQLFVGSHPMAGSEKAGPQHAQTDLFMGRTVVVTTTRKTNRNAADRIVQFWESLGAQTVRMSPAEHDATVAATSHLPHLIATALAAATTDKQLPMTASGWADTTRVAAGDPELWRQILMQNRGHVLKSLDKFGRVLSTLRQALDAQDNAKLLHLLESGKDKRDAVGN